MTRSPDLPPESDRERRLREALVELVAMVQAASGTEEAMDLEVLFAGPVNGPAAFADFLDAFAAHAEQALARGVRTVELCREISALCRGAG